MNKIKKNVNSIKNKTKSIINKEKNVIAKHQEKIKKEPKVKRRNRFLIIIMSILIFFVSCLTIFLLYIILFSPEFEESNLYSTASTVLYDKDGVEFAKLGAQKRELITFDELPEVLIDAIIATEDSRYYQHNGLDAARFGKAVIGQLLGNSGAGGGSTITMQVSKNSFIMYNKSASGLTGLIRKFTDIYLSIFKIEKNYTKEQIIEFYVNAPYLGPNSYGVEEVAQNYFGKSARDVSLVEAAIIAGLFQAPGAYDPHINPESCNKRKNTVLNLMYRHGYITEEEKNIAQNIDAASLLTESTNNSSLYQSFIDTVIDEVIDRTDHDPTKVSMKIYTTMDRSVQEVLTGITNGDSVSFRDDVVELGMAVTSIADGSIVGIGAGRNTAKGQRTYNYATSIRRHPGSTAKPYMVYGPGIEYAKWSTGTTFFDEEWQYSNGQSLKNADGKYRGIMTLKNALASSRNIPAIQGFQQLNNSDIVDFATSLGIPLPTGSGEAYESSAIGAFDGVSPLIQSAAYAAFARGGYYIEPYSYTKIVYQDTDEVVNNKHNKVKVMEPETAYLINNILTYAVDEGYIVKTGVSGTDIAGKTGTSTFDSAFRKKVGLPSSAIMDSWVVMYSPDYSYAQWYGYNEMTKAMVDANEYLTSAKGVKDRKIFAKAAVSKIFKKNSTWDSLNSVVSREIELETIPIQLASPYTPEALRSTEYFIKGTEPSEVSTRFSELSNVTNLTGNVNSLTGTVTLNWTPINTPSAIDSNALLQNFTDSYGQTYATLVEKYYNKRLEYNTTNIGTVQYHVYLKNSDGSLKSLGTTAGNSYTYTTYDPNNTTFVVKTEYTIFKANASSGVSTTINTNSTVETVKIIVKNTPDELSVDEGKYEDMTSPLNITENGISIVNSPDIKVTSKKYKEDGTEVSEIYLNEAGSYYIEYTVTYKSKIYTAKKIITIK